MDPEQSEESPSTPNGTAKCMSSSPQCPSGSSTSQTDPPDLQHAQSTELSSPHGFENAGTPTCSTPSTPSSGTSVRKRKQFTVFEKLSVIDSITIDNPQTKVARETGINESTLRGWLREEASLRAFAKENASSGKVKMRRRTPMKGSKYSDGSAGSYPTDFPGVEWDPSWLAQRNWSSGADVFSMPGCSEASDGGPHGMKLEALSESVEKIKGELEPADMGAVESLLSLQTARAGRPSSSMMSNFPVKSEPGMEHGLMPPMAVGPRFPYFPLCPTAITKDHLYSYRIKTPVGKKRRRPDFQTSPEAARIYDSPQNSHRSPTASVASDTSKSPEDKNSSNKDGKQSPRASSDSLEIESAGKSVSVPVDFVFDQDRQEGEEEEDGEDESQSKDGETTTSSGRKSTSRKDDTYVYEDPGPLDNFIVNSEPYGEHPVYKRNGYTIIEKLKIIARVTKKGETQAQVARDLKIPESTLRGWLREETQLRAYVESRVGDVARKRKKVKSGRFPALDRAVFDWFVKTRSSGRAVSGPQLIAQAQKLYTTIYGESGFLATAGWLSRWKARHGVNKTNMMGDFHPETCMPIVKSELERELSLPVEPIEHKNTEHKNFVDASPPEKPVRWDVELVLKAVGNAMHIPQPEGLEALMGIVGGGGSMSDLTSEQNAKGSQDKSGGDSSTLEDSQSEEGTRRSSSSQDKGAGEGTSTRRHTRSMDANKDINDSAVPEASTSVMPDEVISAPDAILWVENLISWADQHRLPQKLVTSLHELLVIAREKALGEWTKEHGLDTEQIKQLQKVLGL